MKKIQISNNQNILFRNDFFEIYTCDIYILCDKINYM